MADGLHGLTAPKHLALLVPEVSLWCWQPQHSVGALATRIQALVTMPQKPSSAAKDFIAGGVGGSCTVVVGQPLDTIKVLQRRVIVKF